LLAGVAVPLLANLVLTAAVVVVSDPIFGFGIRIQEFAGQAWFVPALTVLLTAFAAAWVARTVGESAAALHGLLVGVVVAAISLAFSNQSSLTTLALFVLTVAVGWSGGLARSSTQKEVA
ncbi:MAG TPA: hypothetical protein VHJ78_11915, partial [Actinomycetota bacterium]|nr:hypothetical protein [Actinomycetota bacterium]